MQEFLSFAIIKLVPRQNGLLFTKINKHAVYRATFNFHGKFLGNIWFENMPKNGNFPKWKIIFEEKDEFWNLLIEKFSKIHVFSQNLSFHKYYLASLNMAPSNICRIISILIGIKVVYTSIRTGANVHIYIHAETQKHLQTRWNDDHEYDYCLNISFYVPVYFYWRD